MKCPEVREVGLTFQTEQKGKASLRKGLGGRSGGSDGITACVTGGTVLLVGRRACAKASIRAGEEAAMAGVSE